MQFLCKSICFSFVYVHVCFTRVAIDIETYRSRSALDFIHIYLWGICASGIYEIVKLRKFGDGNDGINKEKCWSFFVLNLRIQINLQSIPQSIDLTPCLPLTRVMNNWIFIEYAKCRRPGDFGWLHLMVENWAYRELICFASALFRRRKQVYVCFHFV